MLACHSTEQYGMSYRKMFAIVLLILSATTGFQTLQKEEGSSQNMGWDHIQVWECSHGVLAMFWVGLPATTSFYKHQTKEGSHV